MQPVNDDMDALFRRAADSYPLRTGGADFEALLQKMQQPGEAVAPPPPKEQRRNYSWLLLLLLLVPFVCRYYPGKEDEKGPQTATQNSRKTNSTNQDFTTHKNTVPTNQPRLASSSTTSDIYQNNQPAAQQITANDKQVVLADKPVVSSSDKVPADLANSTATEHTSLRNRKRKATTSATEKIMADKYSAGFANARKQKHGNSRNVNQKSAFASKAGTTANAGNESKDSSFAGENIISGSEKNSAADKQDTSTAIFAKGDKIATEKNKTTLLADSTASDSTTTAGKKEQKKKEKVKPFFYIGVTGGIDYSAVKSKQTAGTGSNAGLIAGYSFGRHWVVETGFIRAHKKYRSEGEFVDTTGLGLAGHTQLANVHGSCTMFEIPVNVQFHFGNKARSHWYIGTGVSSYLMKKEKYDYMGKRYNMVYYSEKEYTNSTKNWFSVLQFSGGYQVQMGKLGSLRAEPYVKLPLSGIGVASLPLSSTGINIGYTRPL